MSRSLRIAINAQVMSGGGAGGVETAISELICALGKLSAREDDAEEYVIVGPWQNPDWLRPFISGRQRIVRGAPPAERRSISATLKKSLGPLRPVLSGIRAAVATPSRRSEGEWLSVPGGARLFEQIGCDVVHFPYQPFVRCRVPSVYNPHDLQHLHFAQFFSEEEIARREEVYRLGCAQSAAVVVASEWTRSDFVAKYDLPPDKVQVIPWAAPVYGTPDLSVAMLAATRAKYNLHSDFALYPAATWEHKNHLRLLRAAAQLREQDQLGIEIVCTGHQTPHIERIEVERRVLGLERAVRFLGRIPGEDLRALYCLARFVIVPTLFEAASAPLFEAWRDNAPIACAAVTSLPEQAGDAALLFDPFSVEAIAEAMRRMQQDERLREELTRRGRRRLGEFRWERTARAYRAIYRRAAGRRLSDEEQHLLARMQAGDVRCKLDAQREGEASEG